MTPLERLIARFAAYMARSAATLIRTAVDENGNVVDTEAVTKWYEDARREIVRYHTASGLLGSGVSELTPQLRDILRYHLKVQLAYFDGFYIKVVDERKFWRREAARAVSYANGIKVPYWAGRTEFLPLPAMPAQGTQCRGNCKCKWDIQVIDRERGDYDCYWVRHAEDSCQTCIVRARRWAPFRIRGGEVQVGN